jgi:hypothetical protein
MQNCPTTLYVKTLGFGGIFVIMESPRHLNNDVLGGELVKPGLPVTAARADTWI